ncbi:MAG: phage antirepressor KilAC domain-containing protein [Phocaeicola massiliensis]
MDNQVFQYNGSPITFQIGKATMVNATEMAKPFGKFPWKWLELPSTKEYIRALSENRSLAYNQLVVSVKGGNDTSKRGNWFHEDVALEFARWLSPQFAIWCNDRIKELMRYGMTATTQTIDSILADPENAIKLLTALKDERKKVSDLESKLNSQASKVEYADNILLSERTYTTTEIAKLLNMSACKLNRLLSEKGVLYRQQNQWLLSPAFHTKGYITTKALCYNKKDGRISNMFTTVWTDAGKRFICNLIGDNNMFSSVES